MLLPGEDRDLYTDLLKPPPGTTFDQGVGATYSLDLDTLLSVLLHLFLYSGEAGEEELLSNAVALLEALKRTGSRLSLYCQQGRIHAPGAPRDLYPFLEEVVEEVALPRDGGSFHPKMWLLRFRDLEGEVPAHLRLAVLTRNVTGSESWDVSLQLEGRPTEGEPADGNRPLAEFLSALPRWAGGVGDNGEEGSRPGPDLDLLADEASRARWELPEGFDRVRFHVPGLEGRGWRPEPLERLLVVSPFCSAGALEALAKGVREPPALISRSEELDEISPAVLDGWGSVHELDEVAEGEFLDEGDGDEDGEGHGRGLHAKLYLTEEDGRTRLHVGSANATGPALLSGANVELVAGLSGPTAAAGGIEDLLDRDEGFGRLIREYRPPEEPPGENPERKRAERAVREAREELRRAGLVLACEREGSRWQLTLSSERALSLEGVRELQVWPVSVDRDWARDAGPLRRGEPVPLPSLALRSLTGLTAFRVVAGTGEAAARATFVLNLSVEGLPREERDAAIVRGIIESQDDFLRYLLLILEDLDLELPGTDGFGPPGSGAGGGWGAGFETLPLLEEMVRAYCRNPSRLDAVRQVLEDLRGDGTDPGEAVEETEGAGARDVVPHEFLELWSAFEAALEAEGREGGTRP